MKKYKNPHTKEAIGDPLLGMIGQCSIELINEEADAALKDVDWKALEDVNLDEWFKEAMNSQMVKRKPTKRSMPRRVLSYAASFLLFVIVTFMLIIATHEPARAAVIRFIVERFPKYSEYFIRPEDEDINTELTRINPGYIPDGFRLTQLQDTPDRLFMYWENESTDQFIVYHQTSGDSTLMLDTETATIHQIIIGKVAVEVIEKDDSITMQFFSDDVCYAVTTNLSYQECILIAESILEE